MAVSDGARGLAADPQDRLFTPAYCWILATNFFAVFNLNLFILLPTFVRGLGGTEATIGVLMGTHAIVALASRFWLGGWLDRFGRRRFILIGVGLGILASTGYLFVNSVGVLLFACRALHGLSFACYFTAMLTLTGDTVPASRRTQAIAWTGVAGFAANAVAPPVGEFVLNRSGIGTNVPHAYHMLFLVALGIMIVAAILATRTRAVPHEGGNGLSGIRAVVAQLQRRSVRVLMVPTVAMGIGFGTAFMFIKDYAATRGLANVGAFFATYSVFVVCLRVGAGRTLDRVNRNAIILPSLGLLALGVLLQTQLDGTGWLIALGLLCGGGHGLLYPTLSAMAYEAAPPEQRGVAMAVYTMGFDGGLALGTIPLGLVARHFGYPAMYVTGAGITFLGLAAYATLMPRGGRFSSTDS